MAAGGLHRGSNHVGISDDAAPSVALLIHNWLGVKVRSSKNNQKLMNCGHCGYQIACDSMGFCDAQVCFGGLLDPAFHGKGTVLSHVYQID